MGAVEKAIEEVLSVKQPKEFVLRRTEQRIKELAKGQSFLVGIHAWSRITAAELKELVTAAEGQVIMLPRFGGYEIWRKA